MQQRPKRIIGRKRKFDDHKESDLPGIHYSLSQTPDANALRNHHQQQIANG